MEMIALLSKVSAPIGPLIITDPQSKANEYARSRRVQRTATLDGNNVFQDFGATITDNNIELVIQKITEDQRDIIILFFASSELWLSTPAGFFTVVPVSFDIDQPKGRISLWIKEQIA